MAFPASTQTLEDALAATRRTATKIKGMTQSLRNRSEVENIPRMDFVRLQQALQQSVDIWDQAATVTGIATYAQEQYTDSGLDLATEYTAMRSTALSLRDWIYNAVPEAASGAAELQILNTSGVLTDLTVSPAQSAGFRTEADAFIATID